MKTYFVYKFIGEPEERRSKVYEGLEGMEQQGKFVKKNRKKLEYCEVKFEEVA